MRYQYHLVLLCLISLFAKVSIAGDCKTTNAGKDYRGKVSKTRGGLECQRWSTKLPHKHMFSNKSHPEAGLDENYCRNPDGEPDGPWCYTTSKQKRWDYCYIPLCEPDLCKKTVEGKEYRGLVSKTRNGVVCQRWDSQKPHSHGITPDTHRNFGLNKNFCRNPDGEPGGPWCYTTSADERWDYCDIPLCDPCSSMKCGLYERCVVSDDGNAECVCNKACPFIYKPVCGSDGETYPNKCVLKFQACEKGVKVDIVKNGKCEDGETGAAAGIKKPTIIKGHIKVNKEISIDSKSCLVITLREAIYCAKFEECPDKTIATHVIRDLMVSPDNGIPYNLTVASKLKSNRYLIEATLNRGWCHIDDKDDKKWLRDGDLFNNIEHSIEIDRPGDYNEDIVVIELKEEEATSGDGSESECEKERQRIFDSFPVIDGEKQPLAGAFIPQCNKDGTYKQVQCHGSTGYCWCVHDNGKKRKETEVRFKQPNCTTDPCDGMKCDFYSYCKVMANGTATCQCKLGCPLIYKPVCASDGKEYANKCVMKFEACISRRMIYISNQGKCKQNKTLIAGAIRIQTTTISGLVVLVSEDSTPISSLKDLRPEIERKSCLVITLRKAIYCKKFEDCPDTTVATHVIRNITVSSDNWIPYSIVVTAQLKPSRYLIEGTLNRGWCYIDHKDDKKWIRDGDFFNDVEHSVEIDRTGKYDKDITIRYFKEKKLKLQNRHGGKDNKSECEKERQSVFDSFPVIHGKKRPLVGAFMPQCNEDGSYKKVQCHGSTGHCWCVDESGTKRKETEVRFKQPDCDEGEHNRSECEKERQSVLDSFPLIEGKKRPLLGAFIPQCNEDGSYKKVQCHGSTGYCWCVDESGTKRKGTEVRFRQPDCEKGEHNRSECEKERQSVLDSFPLIEGKKRPLLGAFIPQCNEDGSYKKVQCHGSTGYCWCVDESGTKRKGTEVRFRQPDCEKGEHNRSECEKERQSVLDSFPLIEGKKRPLLGAFIPQCNEDGSYKKVQCHGSTGYCWCVDESGTKRKGTEVRFRQPDCEKGKHNRSECEKERQSVFDSFPIIQGERKPPLGAFMPQCNEDGSYKKVQCHGSTGHCWCVDESGTKQKETEVRFKQPDCEKGNKSKCEKHRQSVFDTFPVINGKKQPMPGAYIPQCNEDGSYKKVQCHSSTGYCWCVDEDGKKQEGTQLRFKQPTC